MCLCARQKQVENGLLVAVLVGQLGGCHPGIKARTRPRRESHVHVEKPPAAPESAVQPD
jgi:hypothetical protein